MILHARSTNHTLQIGHGHFCERVLSNHEHLFLVTLTVGPSNCHTKRWKGSSLRMPGFFWNGGVGVEVISGSRGRVCCTGMVWVARW